ncbi:MAG: RNA methyltransferase [bacterium]
MDETLMSELADQVVFVLVEPSHPGNIGSAARALKTMGWKHLRLIAPRWPDCQSESVLSHPDAVAYASGATDLLAQARVLPDWSSALSDVTLAIGLADRPRGFAPPALDCAQACQEAMQEAVRGSPHRVAFVFGTERIGLTSEQLERCQRLAQIDANPAYSSLNLAQAVQVVAYEARRASGWYGTFQQDSTAPVYASQDEIEQFLVHFREACIAVQFIDPEHPKKLFERIRRLLARTRLEREEVQLLRGLCKQMILAAQQKR